MFSKRKKDLKTINLGIQEMLNIRYSVINEIIKHLKQDSSEYRLLNALVPHMLAGANNLELKEQIELKEAILEQIFILCPNQLDLKIQITGTLVMTKSNIESYQRQLNALGASYKVFRLQDFNFDNFVSERMAI